MSGTVCSGLLVVLLTLPALAAGPARSEARVYFATTKELAGRLGARLGELDICTQGRTPDNRDYLVVNADAAELEAVRAAGLEVEITWPDIRDKFRAMTGCNPDDGSFRDFGYFLTYWEMRDSVRHLARNYPDIVAIDSSPRSFQNRRFYILKISDNPGVDENEPQTFFNGATHAREPMSTHACVAFATLLCTRYATDSLTRWLVDNREIFISPVQNPDGYIYNSDSGGSSANWRKNRNNTSPRTGPGVDLNRNFGYHWAYNNTGSSGQPSSETYRGPSRFSEPEAQVIRDFMLSHRFRTVQDFHTYGRYNLLPWGFSTAWPAHGEDSLAWRAIADTMLTNNGYSTGPTMRVLYETNGNSTDWAFADTVWEGTRKFVSYGVSSELGINDFWYGSTNPSYVDNEVSLNMPNCFYLARVAGVYLDAAGMVVNDTTQGNANAELDPGEEAFLWFKVKNRAVHPVDTAKAVIGVLVSPDSIVHVITPSADFPDMPRMTHANNGADQIRVRCSDDATPGAHVDLRLEVQFTDAGVTVMQPLKYRITIGNHPIGVTERVPDYSHADPSLTAFPNPARSHVVLSAILPESGSEAEISIFDPGGRLVWSITLPAAGAHRVVWPGVDNHGRPLPAGVYFCRLSSVNSSVLARVTLSTH